MKRLLRRVVFLCPGPVRTPARCATVSGVLRLPDRRDQAAEPHGAGLPRAARPPRHHHIHAFTEWDP